MSKLHTAAVEVAEKMQGYVQTEPCGADDFGTEYLGFDKVGAAIAITAAYNPLVQTIRRVLNECGMSHPITSCPRCIGLQDALRKVVGDA